ncbi:MAG: D-glycero-beta-D-manno-heptose-7-phosphate kinase [Parvibaculum sp.]
MTGPQPENSETLQTLVVRLAGARALVVGDALLDRFVYGRVERISPEAPIPVLSVEAERAMPGGAGNVARNLAALGAGVVFLSVVGDDEAGAALVRAFDDHPGIEARLTRAANRITTVKTRFVAMSQQVLRADSETTAALDAAEGAALVASLEGALKSCDVLVLSDYGKGVLTPAVTAAAIAAARAAKIPVVVDPKGRDYARYAGASVVTPNRKELAEATATPASNDGEIVAAARGLAAAHGLGAVVVTRAQDGMSVVTESDVHHLKAEAREVFDVSGAGDTVVATLACALGAGASLADAARLANSAAGIVVGKVGTAVVHRDELASALREHELSAIEAKLAGRERAAEIAEGWRARGLKVGFTNGCFDLLHPGHVALLARARALCDRLVVGLNSDASVRRLKGEGRPVQPDIARATVLAALGTVDLVTIFEEDTPQALIEALKPDLLVKGGDYKVADIVGADFVQAQGGRVEIVDIVPGFSTTGTIAKLGPKAAQT